MGFEMPAVKKKEKEERERGGREKIHWNIPLT